MERRFTKDEPLTNATICRVTETTNSSIRGYYEGMRRAIAGDSRRIR